MVHVPSPLAPFSGLLGDLRRRVGLEQEEVRPRALGTLDPGRGHQAERLPTDEPQHPLVQLPEHVEPRVLLQERRDVLLYSGPADERGQDRTASGAALTGRRGGWRGLTRRQAKEAGV